MLDAFIGALIFTFNTIVVITFLVVLGLILIEWFGVPENIILNIGIGIFVLFIIGLVFDSPKGDDSIDYGPEQSETDSNEHPGYHQVDGHYRGGTYVDSYMRSNPDGDTSNNINSTP